MNSSRKHFFLFTQTTDSSPTLLHHKQTKHTCSYTYVCVLNISKLRKYQDDNPKIKRCDDIHISHTSLFVRVFYTQFYFIFYYILFLFFNSVEPSTFIATHTHSLTIPSPFLFLSFHHTSFGFPGRECLLRSICETSHFNLEDNGVFGDIFHFIFT